MMVDILYLPNFKIISLFENELDSQIQVQLSVPPFVCPHCGSAANLYKHGSREQLCMDLPIHGKRVGLLIQRQRYRCRECNQTFWERLDHTIDEKRSCTKRRSLLTSFMSYEWRIKQWKRFAKSSGKGFLSRNGEA